MSFAAQDRATPTVDQISSRRPVSMTNPSRAPQQSRASATLALAPIRSGSIQRTCGCGGGEMMEEQKMQRATVQPSLTISDPGDPSELEADRAADEVMRMPDSAVQGPHISRMRDASVHRSCATCAAAEGDLSSVVASGVSGSGQALDESTRAFMESRFGQDFGHVRVHTGGAAADSARSINALAYTVGSDIVFGTGQYAPETGSGRRILAHELAHTVQQGNPLPTLRRQEDAATPLAGGAAVSHTFAAQGVNIILRPSCASVAGFSFALVEAAVRDAVDKIFNTVCIEETHRKPIQANLRKNGFEFRAADSARLDNAGACAEGTGFSIPANIVTLGTNALTADCGPLASTVLHEIVHIVRGFFGEQLPVSCEASCYGQPGDPVLCRDTDVTGRRIGGAAPKAAG